MSPPWVQEVGRGQQSPPARALFGPREKAFISGCLSTQIARAPGRVSTTPCLRLFVCIDQTQACAFLPLTASSRLGSSSLSPQRPPVVLLVRCSCDSSHSHCLSSAAAAMINLFDLKNKKAAEAKAAASSNQPKIAPGLIRVKKDMSELKLEKGVSIDFAHGETELMKWKLVIRPDDGIYKNGTFVFDVKVPDTYPHDPPKVLCETTVFHPNIDMEGHVCLNILREDGKPVLTMSSVIMGMQFLMLEPNADDPLNKEVRVPAALANSSRSRCSHAHLCLTTACSCSSFVLLTLRPAPRLRRCSLTIRSNSSGQCAKRSRDAPWS